MKNVILFMSLVASTYAYAFNEHRILEAMLASNYDEFVAVATLDSFLPEQKEKFLEINTNIINLRKKLVATHSFSPAICKELYISLAGIMGITASAGLIGGSIVGGISAAACKKDDLFNLACVGVCAGFLSASISTYVWIKYLIAAWKQPKKLLDNALRIQSMLLNS